MLVRGGSEGRSKRRSEGEREEETEVGKGGRGGGGGGGGQGGGCYVLNTKAVSHDRKHYQYGQMMGPSRNGDKELCTFKKKEKKAAY